MSIIRFCILSSVNRHISTKGARKAENWLVGAGKGRMEVVNQFDFCEPGRLSNLPSRVIIRRLTRVDDMGLRSWASTKSMGITAKGRSLRLRLAKLILRAVGRVLRLTTIASMLLLVKVGPKGS